MARKFVPFSNELADNTESQAFIRRQMPGTEPDDPDAPAPVPVTPAEAVDLSGHIRQILQTNGLSGDKAEDAITQIEAALAATPTRVALPEIKITSPSSGPEPDDETGDAPKLATIDYEREEEIIKRIRVGCTCGETILLDCDY